MQRVVVGATRGLLGSIGRAGKKGDPVVMEPESGTFIVSFCGSGTGHMMQALTLTRTLQNVYGMRLTGVITDSDASEKLLNELIHPLGVPVLILPAITIVTSKGVLPPHRVVGKAIACIRGLKKASEEIRAFLAASKAALILNMWQISLGKYLQLNALPASVRVVHVAAQFAHLGVKAKHVKGGMMAGAAKGTIDVMASIFGASGPCVAISSAADAVNARGSVASAAARSLAPIIDVPPKLATSPPPPKLLLCYFLTLAPARRLERLLHAHPIPGLETHVFTSEVLTPPRGRAGGGLSVHSHAKERKLFVELFHRCTAVLCSTGNETVWEAVCRGVPVLTIPTAGHGEQILNATVHAAALPHNVRARSSLRMADLRWLVDFTPSEDSAAESEGLRARCAALERPDGLELLLHAHEEPAAAEATSANAVVLKRAA